MKHDMLPAVAALISVGEPAVNLARTKTGVEFDPLSDIWAYQDGLTRVSLDFKNISGLSAALLNSAKSTLRWFAENRSPDHLENLFTRLQHFTRTCCRPEAPHDSIAAADILNYKSCLESANAWYVGTLAGLLKKWHRLGYPGVDGDVLQLFEQLRTKGNAKGVAVLTMDPEEGPYTTIEVEGLQAALNAAFANGRIETADYVMAWLYLLLGQRNKQYAALKVCDVRITSDADGNTTYSIMMPRAKKGTVSVRDGMLERPLIEQFGEILVGYAKQVERAFSGILDDPRQAPLFPSSEGTWEAAGYEYHQPAADMGSRLKRTLERLSVHSERTGKVIKVSARRFRRTIGTRAAEEGYSPLVIAGLLDHADTQNVGVYTANSPAIIERIDRAIAMDMAPLAQAFAGSLVDGSYSDPESASRIIDLRIDRSGKTMGECGKDSYCGFSAPIACYTCRNFEAWVDGPHEAVLAHLLKRREQLLQSGDKRIAAVNDRTILAVAAVIQCCTPQLTFKNTSARE